MVELEVSEEYQCPLKRPDPFLSKFIYSILSFPHSRYNFKKFIGAPVLASSFTNIDFYSNASGGGMKNNLLVSEFTSTVFLLFASIILSIKFNNIILYTLVKF